MFKMQPPSSCPTLHPQNPIHLKYRRKNTDLFRIKTVETESVFMKIDNNKRDANILKKNVPFQIFKTLS